MAHVEQEPSVFADDLQQRFQQLRSQLAKWEAAYRPGDPAPIIPSFSPLLDRWLPGGGFRGNQLVEWFAKRPGSGAATLSLLVARQALRPSPGRSGVLVVLDTTGSFYPPAAVHCGIAPQQMLIVRPRDAAEAVWAADLALRSPAVAVVWGQFSALSSRDARRLRLSAEEGQSLGLWIRPWKLWRAPSWSDVQLAVDPIPNPRNLPATRRRWRIELLRCRGAEGGKCFEWEWPSEGEPISASPGHSPPSNRCALG